MFGLGITELLCILAIIMLLFGATFAKRFTSSIVESIREVRKIRKEVIDGEDRKPNDINILK